MARKNAITSREWMTAAVMAAVLIAECQFEARGRVPRILRPTSQRRSCSASRPAR